MLNFTRIPAPRVTLVDPQTGVVSNEWFRFFNNLYSIIYAATGNVTPGTYGSATVVPQITVDAFGAITAITDVTIALDASQIVSGTIASARISGAYTGITGVGTLIAGTWNASTIGVNYGGTGQTSYTDGQLLIGNSTGNTLTKATLTAGTAIGISNGAGAITITNTLPDQTVVLTNGTGISVTGTYPNFTITNTAPSSGGTVTSVAALTLGTTGTDLSSTVANPTTTPVITLNVPTASSVNRGALSAADWTTFNSKAPGVTFTTNYIPYGQGTTTLNQSANLTFNGTTLTTIDITTTGNTILGNATADTLNVGNGNLVKDASGNIGIGVTPSAWVGNGFIQFPGNGFLGNATGFSSNNLMLGSNAYYDASWKYKTSSLLASKFVAGNGVFTWEIAPSGTAGAAITWSEAMRINSAGNVGIGTDSPVGTLDVASLTPNVTIRNTKSGLWTDGEVVGTLSWYTDDPSGIGAHDVASIQVTNVGSQTTPNSNIIFSTAIQNVAMGERVRIDFAGNTYVQTGNLWQYAPAPTSKAAAATLTAAEVRTGILNTTGTTYTVTLPTGTALDTAFAGVPTTSIGFDWFVVNTASGTITIAVGASGMTSLGTLTIATGVSAQFRLRRTAANTYVLYRLG